MVLVIYGSLITPQDPYVASYLPQALLYIENGIIQWMEEQVEPHELSSVMSAHGLEEEDIDIIRLQRGQFLMPGFIDTHTHAPQFPNLGRGGQYELLDWLSNLTFPTEAKFADREHAKAVYIKVVNQLLDCGTTTCCYFSSAHVSGTEVLADIVSRCGQRAFIGFCNMDRNAPDFYLKGVNHSQSLEQTREVISFIHSLKNPLVQPILTPRFAISCTGELMKGLSDIALEGSLRRLLIQTHIAENLTEIDVTASLFPTHTSYTHIYEERGLLGPTTILAHGCYLTSEELTSIKRAGAGISHCPTSNFHLSSGVAKVAEWLDLGIKVGLGTDVSGGFSPSILTTIQHASIASKLAARMSKSVSTSEDEFQEDSPNDLSLKTALTNANLLHLATLGGAQLCNLEDVTGSLETGKDFDALIVDLRPETGNPKLWWDSDNNMEDSFLPTRSKITLAFVRRARARWHRNSALHT
ncbi:hypothetical protein Clacol_008064 [Clathrus columnatus]|uniref:Probable guanine deaminase n=1 Tax=Clathrus columnatus TaxID=1419009 RepID=A0AAV5AJ72_9AGAM|nr:hypothetical protein Clacol_008064 [Clathrus columnatus]